MKKLPSKHTVLIDAYGQRLAVNGIQMIQLQIEQEDQDAFIDLSRKEARELAQTLIDHCNLADS